MPHDEDHEGANERPPISPTRTLMSRLADIPLSVLDLAPITRDGTPAETFRHSVDLAQQTERLGYNRYWLAEHHNMPGIASSATAVLIG